MLVGTTKTWPSGTELFAVVRRGQARRRTRTRSAKPVQQALCFSSIGSAPDCPASGAFNNAQRDAARSYQDSASVLF